MITKAKLDIFKKFNGDLDGFSRTSSPKDRVTITDDNWYAISELLQRLSIMQAGLGSKEFNEETQRRLKSEVAADIHTELKQLATS